MEQRKWQKEIRETKGMTQSDFANLLNVLVTTYASWEQGVRTPNTERAKEVANTHSLCGLFYFLYISIIFI